MNRTKKKILSIIVTLLLTACIGFTVYQIKSQNTPPSSDNSNGSSSYNSSSSDQKQNTPKAP